MTGQIHPLMPAKVFRPGAAVTDSFLESKSDRRLMKHSSFLSRVRDSSDKVSKARRHRTRRPGNKMASLGSLADALPELADPSPDDAAPPQPGKVRHRSLRSRKGALKRKEGIVRGEMQRFGLSMASLAEAPQPPPPTAAAAADASSVAAAAAAPAASDPSPPAQTPGPMSNRWAALRGYISATMEQNPAFAGK